MTSRIPLEYLGGIDPNDPRLFGMDRANSGAPPIPVMNSEMYATNSQSAGRGQPGVVMTTGGGLQAPPTASGPPTGLIGSELALQGGYNTAQAALLGGYGNAQNILGAPGMTATAQYNPNVVNYNPNVANYNPNVANYNPNVANYSMGGVTGAISQGVTGAGSAIGQGVSGLNPYATPGAQSLQLQAALAGSLGQPAQQQAYANFQESPGQQYLREQSERALLRNSAALGGLGGGNVRQELSRQAIGLAQQDFENSFNRLGSITQTGLTAASNQGALRGQEASIIGQLRGQEAGIAGDLEGRRMNVLGALEGQRLGALSSLEGQRMGNLTSLESGRMGNLTSLEGGRMGNLTSLESGRMGTQGSLDQAAMGNQNTRVLQMGNNAMNTGQNLADLGFQTGSLVSSGRTRAGQDIAGAVGGTVSSLANLSNQGGRDVSDVIGEGAGNLATIIAGAGAGQSGSQTGLAALIAQIIASQGNQVAGLPGVPYVQDTRGIIGNVGAAMQGAGALMAASDIRLKENIQRIGTAPNGIPLYVWDWNEEGRRVTGETFSFGVIAQEVMATHPEAVAEGEDGWLRVNYGTVFNG